MLATSGGLLYVLERKAVVLDPQTERWTSLPDPPTPRQHTTATTDPNGRVVHVSGFGYAPIGYASAAASAVVADCGACKAGFARICCSFDRGTRTSPGLRAPAE